MKPEVTKKPYFLLAEPEAISDGLLNSLLGLAVENPYMPLRGTHRPRYPLKPRDGLDYLYPDMYTICKDFRRVEKTSKTSRASTKLQDLVKFVLEKGGSESKNLQAAGFRRISMRDARTKIEDLLSETTNPTSHNNLLSVEENKASEEENAQSGTIEQEPSAESSAQTGGFLSSLLRPLGLGSTPPTPTPTPTPDPDAEETLRKAAQQTARAHYREEVLELLRKQEDGKLAIITSIITCTDLTKVLDKAKRTAANLDVGTGPAARPYAEVQFGAEYSRTHDVGTEGSYENEHLIACSYHLLEMEKPRKGFNVPWFNIKLVPKHVDDVQVFVSPEEMWHVGDVPMEGDTAVMLGGRGSDEDESGTDAADDEGFAFSLLYRGEKFDDDVSVPSDDESEDGDDEKEQEDYKVARDEASGN